MARAHAVSTGAHWRTDIKTGSHALIADETATLGGVDAGPAPYDLLVSALSACTAITLRMYADRKGWPLTGVEVDVHFIKADDTQRIERVLRFSGDLDETQRARLADIAERTPVTLTLKQGLPIATSVAA